MPADNPQLLREKAAQCLLFARSAQASEVAEMLLRMAEGFLGRALKAEQGFRGNLDTRLPLKAW
jgi:hypothetical protein